MSEITDARRAVRNVSALAAASIVSKGLLFIWQIVLGNWFGPADYGIYNTVLGLMAIAAAVASFSMGLIVIRNVARAPETIGRYAAAMLFTQTVLSLVAYAGCVLGAILGGYSDTIIAFTAIAALSLFVDMFGNIGHDLLVARERMVNTALVEIGHIVLRVTLAALLLVLGFGLLGVYVAALITGVLRALALIYFNRRAGHHLQLPLDRALVTKLLVDSAPLALTAFLTLAYSHADKLMTTAIIGETNTGYLGPAFVIHFGVVELFSTTVLVAVYPLLARYHEAGGAIFGFITEKLARFMLIVTLPVALGISIFAQEIILTIYNPVYLPTVGVLRIFIWYTLLMMVGNVFAKALLIQNRQRYLLGVRVLSLLLNVSLNVVLLAQFGDARGAAVASLFAEALMLGLLVSVFRAEGWDRRRIAAGVMPIVLCGAVAGAVMLLVGQVHFILGGIVGVLVYAAGILRGGVLQSDDWDLLYRLLLAMPGGAWVRRYWQREGVTLM